MATTTDMTELVQQAQAGDRSAFDQLVRMFHSRVFAMVMRRLRNTAEADEVVQEVFLRAFCKLDQLAEAERFAGWVSQIAVRLSINRAVRRPAETCVETEIFDGVPQPAQTPLCDLLRHEDAAEVHAGLQQLSRLDRDTLWAFYFEGASLREMSEQFDSPVGTIKRRLHTARGRLRDVISGLQTA
ncbi:MAG: RNA polymerase sigma factor [Planctomycetota bacterium]